MAYILHTSQSAPNHLYFVSLAVMVDVFLGNRWLRRAGTHTSKSVSSKCPSDHLPECLSSSVHGTSVYRLLYVQRVYAVMCTRHEYMSYCVHVTSVCRHVFRSRVSIN